MTEYKDSVYEELEKRITKIEQMLSRTVTLTEALKHK